jgi:hypothetical protein
MTRILSLWPNRISLFLVISLSVTMCGCIGATRLPARSLGPTGEKILPQQIELGFLQVGSTHREEVAHQLAAIDTSYSNPRLFWARWSESHWGYWWVVGFPCNTNCMEGDAKRKWHVKNLLVSFDQNGVVANKQMVEDGQIWRALHSSLMEVQPPALDFSEPIRVALTNTDLRAVLLSTDSMEFEPEDSSRPNAQVPLHHVSRFRHSGILDIKRSMITCHALELSEKSALGKKVTFCAEPSQIGILFQYLQQQGPSSMNWQ